MKRILKIGLSLLIALCFLLPTGAVIADKEGQNEAVDYKEDIDENPWNLMKPYEKISSDTNPVIEQDTDSSISNLLFENPAGDFIFMVTGEIDPVEEWYQPWFKIETTEDGSVFEPELEIYEMNCGESFCIYETSFEDNARNYMEWGQIDLDLGYGDDSIPGGYYDGWAWSDARATDGDHSFKSTMYDEYKNMQDDKLYLKDLIDLTSDDYELCDGTCIDVDDVGTVKVEFDTFVDGEYADDWPPFNDAPLDYLQFGYSVGDPTAEANRSMIEPANVPGRAPTFMNSDTSPVDNDGDGYADSFIFFDTSMGLYDQEDFVTDYRCIAEKIDGSPGWWHVWAELDVDELGLDEDDFGIFFEWKSDKERVYEGAYVDNIKISITEAKGEKIYQGHSQDWLEEDEGTSFFKFPLIWDDVEVGTYKAIGKIKTDNGSYVDHDLEEEGIQHLEVKFKIGDLVDCEITEISVEDDFTHEPIPDGGTFSYPSDAHTKFTYHNAGNVPLTDVTVTATGYEEVKETLFEDDFEGMSQWAYFYEPYPLTVVTPPDFIGEAWSGSRALYFGNPDTWHITGGADRQHDGDLNQIVNYVGYSQAGFSMEDVDEAYMDFYYKAVLPENANLIFGMLGAYYVVGLQYILQGPTCIKSWVGPMQPQGRYASVDVAYQFERLESFGYTLDANGHKTYDTGIYFRLDTSAVPNECVVPEDCFAPGEATWSGVFLDDISIKATVRGDIAWQDSMVIPGPCAPCETCSDQFTWEDVPFSNYEVEISTSCDGDVNANNDMQSSSFVVLDEKEKMSKPEFVDCTGGEPEAWCISDVVGNNCSNDHYALATNCDTQYIPEDVKDFVYLTQENYPYPPDLVSPGACNPIYVGDLNLEAEGYTPPTELIFDGDFEDMAGDGELTVKAFDGAVWTDIAVFTDDVDPDGFNEYFATNPPIPIPPGTVQIAFHYTDDGGWAWGAHVDNVALLGGSSPITYDFESGDMGWTVIDGDGNPANWELGSTYSFVEDAGGAVGQWFYIDDDAAGSGAGPSTDNWLVSPTFSLLTDGAKAPVTLFACDFETWTGTLPTGDPDAFDNNNGWLDSLYGFPYSGSKWAYSWTAGDTLTTPSIALLSSNSELVFYTAAESATHPMNLEVYVNGNLEFADYGYTHTDYEMQTVDLNAYNNQNIVIDFVGNTSDFYGQMLEDVTVVSEDVPPPPEGVWPILNMTYQMDIQCDDDTEGDCLDLQHYVEIEYMYVQDNTSDYYFEIVDEYCFAPYGDFVPEYAAGFVDCSASPCCDGAGRSEWALYKNGVEIFNSNNIAQTDWEPCPGTAPFTIDCYRYIFEFSAGPEDQIKIYYADPGYEFCQENCCCEDPDTDNLVDESELGWILGSSDGTIISQDGANGECPVDGMNGPWYLDECTGCGDDDECVCSDDLSEWTSLTGRMCGNSPGICQWFSGEIVVPADVGNDPEWLCIRIQLDTKAALYDAYQAANPGFTGWNEIRGIGMHIHQLSLDRILDVESHPEYVNDSILYNFEDGTMKGCQGPALQNVDPDAPGWWRDNVECYDCEFDPGFNMVRDTYHGGEYWEQTGDFTFEQNYPAQFIDNYVLWETEIEDTYEAYFFGEWSYALGDGQEARIELSADGGENWFTIDRVHNHKPQVLGSIDDACIDQNFWNNESFPDDFPGVWLPIQFDLTPWAGESILIRARVINTGKTTVPSYFDKDPDWEGGYIGVRDFRILGKQDFLPPTVSISLSGNTVGPGLYAGPVTVTITATDNREVGEIHYILDGTESVVSGDEATFQVSGDGEHTIEYWAVDSTGNEGAHATVSFIIDASPPTVSLTAPEPGLYLFGNKLLSMSKPIIIGAFTAQATADDAQGVAVVKFMLNGDVVGEDTEAPYDAYIAVKNMGSATLKAVAEDGVGNSAEDSMEITYYKFL